MDERKLHCFNVSLAEKGLKTRYIGRKIVHMPVTVTTMDDAEQGARQGDPNGTVYIADRQTGGRGTQGRKWVAESDSNIYMSCVLHIKLQQNEDPTTHRCREFDLDVAGAIAALQTLEEFGLKEVNIKWLNDLWIRGHKLLGALTEYKGKIKVESKEYHLYILGIGLNVNFDVRRDPAMHNISTSAACELGDSLPREEVFSKMCNYLEPLLQMNRHELIKLYKLHEAIKFGDKVKVCAHTNNSDSKLWYFKGIKENWSAQLQDENGESISIPCTDVSLRPIREKVVYILNGPEIETWSFVLLLKTCNALVDIQRYEVSTIATEKISIDKLSSCALVVIGRLKPTPHTKATPTTLKLFSVVQEYIKRGGACLCIGNSCSLFETEKDICCNSNFDQHYAQNQDRIPTVIKTEVADMSTSVYLCSFNESCQNSTETFKCSKVLAGRQSDAEPNTTNSCDIMVFDSGKGKICFCRPNIEITYADVDEYFPKLHNNKSLLLETVYRRDRLFIDILRNLFL